MENTVVHAITFDGIYHYLATTQGGLCEDILPLSKTKTISFMKIDTFYSY